MYERALRFAIGEGPPIEPSVPALPEIAVPDAVEGATADNPGPPPQVGPALVALIFVLLLIIVIAVSI